MRNFILFLGSLIFYAWGEPVYVVLMLFSTLSDYFHGLQIEKCQQQGRTGKGWLISSLCINLGMLGFFKYANLGLALPIGISFYTFQTMSYSIDVYRKEVKAQHSLLDFGVFVTMFPQLIAGPIVKYKTAEPYLRERKVNWQEGAYGLRRFILGLSKKVLFANNAGLLWTEISGKDFASLPVLTAWIGIIAFGLQIYFDFSGYSDMAIGLGEMLGFHFPENFNYPYISKSITEFWRRWHISLSSWFREYVYIPLGGNRKGLPRQVVNLLLVWGLTGIWHGAGWNFLLWGLWFALFLIIEKLFLGKWLQKLPAIAGYCYTMFVVLLGWVFFALEQMPQVMGYLSSMFGGNGAGFASRETWYLLEGNSRLLLLMLVGMTPLPAWIGRKLLAPGEKKTPLWKSILEVAALAVLFFISLAYIVEASYNPFLYFRF